MDSPFTDAILRIIGGRARGIELSISSAEQLAASWLSRSFISADLTGAHAALFTPERLDTIACELTLGGQSMWRRDNGDLKWVQNATISRTGRYRISGKTYDPKRIFHMRKNIDHLTGFGRSDLVMSLATRDFIRSFEYNLADEAKDPHGYLIPTQEWDNDALKDVIKGIDGAKVMVPTQTTNLMGSPGSIRSSDEWVQRRIGFDAPENVLRWHEAMRLTALAVMGVPAALVSPVDASAMREGWRLYLFTVVDPMSKLLQAAARRCGLDVSMNFDKLMASDIANRARAYRQLVDGNMDEARASELTGFGGA